MVVIAITALRQATEPDGGPTGTNASAGAPCPRAATSRQPTSEPLEQSPAAARHAVARPETGHVVERSKSGLLERQTQIMLLSTPGASPMGDSPVALQRWTPTNTGLRQELFAEARRLSNVAPVWIVANDGGPALAAARLLSALAAGLMRSVSILTTRIAARILRKPSASRGGETAAGKPYRM